MDAAPDNGRRGTPLQIFGDPGGVREIVRHQRDTDKIRRLGPGGDFGERPFRVKVSHPARQENGLDLAADSLEAGRQDSDPVGIDLVQMQVWRNEQYFQGFQIPKSQEEINPVLPFSLTKRAMAI